MISYPVSLQFLPRLGSLNIRITHTKSEMPRGIGFKIAAHHCNRHICTLGICGFLETDVFHHVQRFKAKKMGKNTSQKGALFWVILYFEAGWESTLRIQESVEM